MISEKKLLEILLNSGVDVDVATIGFDQKFNDIGLDSLDVFNFFSEIDSELDITIADEDFSMLLTLNDLKDYLNKKI